jgi:transcriptional regulator GlxA family with amidase domain
MNDNRKRTLAILIFDDFEALDVFGPVELFGMLEDAIAVRTLGTKAEPITCRQGPTVVADFDFEHCPDLDMLLVPGGLGTRRAVEDDLLLERLRRLAERTPLVMTVCTGSGLLARTGLLDGVRATSNKRAFAWARAQGPNVEWIERARWVRDGKFATSAGVSAGMDMSLAVIAELHGEDAAQRVAAAAEYEWHRDADWDPFAALNGLGTDEDTTD